MYILRNAAKNLLRNKGRNILIGFIMLVMLTSIAVSVIINTTTEKIIEDYKTRFGAEVYINPDPQKVQDALNKGGGGDLVPGIPLEQKLKFGESNYLKEMTYRASIATKLSDLKAVGEDAPQEDGTITGGSSDSNAILVGFSQGAELTDFKNGSRKVTQGHMPESNNEALISEDLAKLNNLNAGDTITSATNVEGVTTKLALTISGIYYDSTENNGSEGYMPTHLNRRNEVITSADALLRYGREIKENSKLTMDFIDIEATYVLKNPDDIGAFENELRTKGLPDVYSISADEASYNSIVKPVEGVSNIITVFLVLVLVIGGIILVFLSTLTIRERKYEIGVLRAMGMKRFTVARGQIYESLILVALCLVLGLGVGNILSGPVSNAMIETQIKAAQMENQTQNNIVINIGDSNNGSQEDLLSSLDVFMTPEAVAQIAGMALLIALISSTAGLIYILRYEPMKILSERN